jgi:hypothetical protein
MSSPDPRRVSDQLVRLVQLLFGLVAVQPLLLYGDVFVQPFAYEHRTAVFALLAVYVTTVSSWIDWHITMEANPYDIYRGWGSHGPASARHAEGCRLRAGRATQGRP